jgi:hypothetical protein
MSWTFNVPPVELEGFADAVREAQTSGQEGLQDAADQVEAAKAAILLLAIHLKRTKLSASASGHALQATDGDNWHDGISLSVTGVL